MSVNKLKYDAAIAFAFFCVVGLFFSRPLFVVSDFWWHIANGQWIVERLALPQVDPFSLLPNLNSALREALVLKGYWLSQVLFFKVYSLAGMAGLVGLKALILTAIVYSVWRVLLLRGVPSPWAILLLTPLVVYLREYDELRPHLFSFLCFTLLMLSMSGYMKALRSVDHPRWLYALCPAAIMVFWANAHTGYIVGIGFILLCLLVESVRFIAKKNQLSAENLKKYLRVGLAGILATLLNPNGVLLYKVLFVEGVAGGFSETVTEYEPVWKYFSRDDGMPLFYGLLILLVLALIACLYSKNKMDPLDVLLLLVFSVAGFSQFRYSVFFVIIATLVIGRSLFTEVLFLRIKMLVLGRLLVVFCIVSFTITSIPVSALSYGPLAVGSVERVVTFVKDHNLPSPLFSPYEWGGYIQWRLFPEYKPFVDARALSYDCYEDYRQATQGRKAKVFEKYKFNTVIFYLIPPTANQIASIIYSLLKDDNWKLLQVDDNAVVFSKKDSGYNGPFLDKREYIALLKKEMQKKHNIDKFDDKPLIDLAQLSYIQNDIDGAILYFRKAMEVNRDNDFTKEWLKYLDSIKNKRVLDH